MAARRRHDGPPAAMKGPSPVLQRAVAACGRGDWADAERICRQALAGNPRSFAALNLLGFVLAQVGRIAEAADCLGRAVAENPRDTAAQNNLGYILQQLDRPVEALACYDRAIGAEPKHAGAHCNRGHVLLALGRKEEALASCDRALALAPSLAEAHLNRGNALRELGRREAALASFRRAIELDPQMAAAHNDCGALLQKLGRMAESEQSYRQAIALAPTFAEAHNNLGALLRELGRDEDAIACFDRAIAARSDYADAHWNKSLALLAVGDYARGWPLYEWRWKIARGISARRALPQPLWLGDEPLDGKTILLYAEQGLGDAIQFARYAKLVADRGARVLLEIPASLLRLFATLGGVAELVRLGDPLPAFDCHCPLMSLPLAFRTELATIPAPRAYLAADLADAERWRSRLGNPGATRVGLAWAGGFRLDQPELWDLDARRNIGLAHLAPLEDPRIAFYSLQKGERAEAELARLRAEGWGGPKIVDFTAELRDFADTAALVSALDLVITVDTAIAHLAGALGKPVWILNRFDSCWRWLRGRTDSPWYATARLYTQLRPRDWTAVIDAVRVDLPRFARANADAQGF